MSYLDCVTELALWCGLRRTGGLSTLAIIHAEIQGFDLAHINICFIYELLEYMGKGRSCISQATGSPWHRAITGYLGGIPLNMWQNPKASNQTNDSLKWTFAS